MGPPNFVLDVFAAAADENYLRRPGSVLQVRSS